MPSRSRGCPSADVADTPALAVVVVTHQSAGVIGPMLASVVAQLDPLDELVVVDCGSTDDVEHVVRATAPTARFLPMANLGFAGGANAGADATSAPLLVFLNPDSTLHDGCLAALRATAPARPDWAAWQALVTLPGGREVNTRGGVVHFLGMGWAGGMGLPVDGESHERTVAFASGAALAVRREDWEAVGGFDARYFMYGEDLDLSLRLHLSGRGVGVAPLARVEHEYEFSKGDYKWFHLERNRVWTVLGIYPAPLLVLLAPALLAFEIALLPIAARGGWLRAKLRAQLAVLRELPAILRRRRVIQAGRAAGAAEFARCLTADLDSPNLGAVAELRLLARLQAAYWRLVLAVLGTAVTTN